MEKVSLRFEFLNANIQAKYETVIADITLVKEMGGEQINL